MANQSLPVNNQTQAVLSKYGITAPKKITNIQNIHNKTESDIKIVQPDIKVTSPNIQLNPVELAAQRYKNWVESSYGKQKILADKQRQNLEEKDYELRKNLNRVYRRIDELKNQIVEKSRNFKRRLDSSLSSLVPLFIGTLIPVIWSPLMKRIESIEYGFKYLFFGEVPPGAKEDPESFTFAKTIRQFLGMDDSEGKSLFQGIGDIISEGLRKLSDFLEIQKEDRYQALQEVLKNPAPGFDLSSPKDWLNAKEKLGENFEYLGDIMTAMFGGSRSMGNRKAKRDTTNSIEKDNSKKKGKWGSGKLIKKAIKQKTPASSYYLSDQAVKYINSSKSIEIEKLQLLFNEIKKLADEDKAYVSENFLDTFLGKEKTEELKKAGKISQENISYNRRNAKDDETREFLNESYHNNVFKESSRSKARGYGSKGSDSTNATIAFKIDKTVIPELFSVVEGDLYSQDNYSKFKSSIQNYHKNLHGEEISSSAKLVESYNKFFEINRDTQDKIKNWREKAPENYKHLENFGTVNKNTPTITQQPKNASYYQYAQNVPSFTSNDELTSKVIEQAEKDLGKITYVYGGNSYNRTDCSGYISNIYNKFGVKVPKGTLNIYKDAQEGKKAQWVDLSTDTDSVFQKGSYIPNWDNLRAGDIMVWSRYKIHKNNKERANSNYAGHVSLFTGKYDNQGRPIILGNSGPGPNSGKKEVKGTKREGLNDLKSYLGTVRYNLSDTISAPTSVKEQGDQEEDTIIPETPMIDNIIQKTEHSIVETVGDYKIASTNNTPESVVPTISRKSEYTTSQNPIQNTETADNINRDKYYNDILNNIDESWKNCIVSIGLRDAHLKEMI